MGEYRVKMQLTDILRRKSFHAN